jgi:cytochrome c oxidase subunit II
MFGLGNILGAWGLPDGASTFSSEVQFLWVICYIVGIFFTVLIVGLMIWFCIKYRFTDKRQHADSSVNHNTPLEITWSIIPLIIVMVIFALGFKYYMDIDTIPAGAYNIGVVAQKWNWSFTYPNGAISSTLYLPSDRPVELSMTSKDVLHGFWVPDLSIQKDVVPGRVMTIWLDGIIPGKYILQCAEYCGDGHSLMLAPVVVEPQEQFNSDIAKAADIWTGPDGKLLPLHEVGEKLYTTLGCIGCHSVDGSKGTGPTWQNLAGGKVQMADGSTATADYAYLKQAIMYPGQRMVAGFANVMPNYYQQLSPSPQDQDQKRLDAIIWYINSISKNTANKASEPPVPDKPGAAPLTK